MQPIQGRKPATDTTNHKRQKAFLNSLASPFSQGEKDKTRIQLREEREDFSKFSWVHGWRYHKTDYLRKDLSGHYENEVNSPEVGKR